MATFLHLLNEPLSQTFDYDFEAMGIYGRVPWNVKDLLALGYCINVVIKWHLSMLLPSASSSADGIAPARG
jgi:hypothetical protein